ncbi:hypothetical protein F66182_17790 [Fusarium sp. NRRL 66182]|nr:hypothetical protein F66182_17790 [Fusarium sp. NRRL 66182]
MIKNSHLPFTTHILRKQYDYEETEYRMELTDLLPATYRTVTDDLETPCAHNLNSFLSSELLVKRLNAIQPWLWVCGRPMPPRALHRQLVMSRSIVVTEEIDMHMVWLQNRIFIKPLPAYLLDPDFWTAHLFADTSSHRSEVNSKEYHVEQPMSVETYEDIIGCARGFLFSYTALIAHESDFVIACQNGLLPSSVSWTGWKKLCSQVLASHRYSAVNPRYWYGELRLSRLNMVYALRKGSILRGYSSIGAPTSYNEFFRSNFAALITVLGYVVIVLTAMQTGLATDRLQQDDAFEHASYGFVVFSIIAPLGAIFGLIVVMLCVLAQNWAATKAYEARRFHHLGIEPPWRARKI